MNQVKIVACLSHGRGFNDECDSEYCNRQTTTGSSTTTNRRDVSGVSGRLRDTSEYPDGSDTKSGSVGRPRKSDSTILDPKSTGRKRAAADYEIADGTPCEWQGLANCGGGKSPITGCIDGFQENRHHGPDKNTLNNSEGNVHRICSSCHNLWHARNDMHSVEVLAATKHEPREATQKELLNRAIGRKE